MIDRNNLKIRPIIGLEIHVQLATKSKMFCSCPVEFGAEPNSNVCPVCLGMPGVLPVMNRSAVEYAIRTAIALNCQIAGFTKWDRKSYYYPDLPKNYQISQYDLPLSFDGSFDVPTGEGQTRRVGIIRAHLEEDAGKNIHDNPSITQVDLNRTGTPLLEIVTEPDLQSADEAFTFCTELQRLVTYLGVSEGSMQKGQMRFEPNVNVIIEYEGLEYRTPISEVKNLNSFKAVRSAIAYEIERQVNDWIADRDYVIDKRPKENRGWNDEKGITEFQRGKEEAHDYRYFPDPDLVPVAIDETWLEKIKASVGELPVNRQKRMKHEYALSEADVVTILHDKASADLFEAAAGMGHAVTLGKQFISFWSAKANELKCTIAELGIDTDRMGELSKITAEGKINATAAAQIAEMMFDRPDPPFKIAVDQGLVQVKDENQMQVWVDEAFTANQKAVKDAIGNPKKQKQARGFLAGQVMKISGGKADPKIVGKLIEEKLTGMDSN
ncbi:MAG: Asp-tRNA(Asn)/Glu-tRNA(Gln) amidotransferase subunit GatB [Planctomycetota bacterium]|nr:MAG: Asp-tRNA(Asn)/Glu-tRNA(Gln) amidotransferase subunit GatB [Planctomycetota bacterium]